MREPKPMESADRELVSRYFRMMHKTRTPKGPCPDGTVLRLLGRGELPVGHPAYKHTIDCGACFEITESLRRGIQ